MADVKKNLTVCACLFQLMFGRELVDDNAVQDVSDSARTLQRMSTNRAGEGNPTTCMPEKLGCLLMVVRLT